MAKQKIMNVRICRLGRFNHRVNWRKIANWKSRFFKISDVATIANIDVDHFSDGYVYPMQNITTDMGKAGRGTDLLVAIVDQPLDGNFYMHRIDSNRAVISVFLVLGILRDAHIPLENYLIRCIYEMVVFLYEGNGQVDKNVYLRPHHETRGCLFDMNVFIDRVIYSCDAPTICEECITKLRKVALPENFLEDLQSELQNIRNPLYFRIEATVKAHPIAALLLATIFGIVLRVFSKPSG